MSAEYSVVYYGLKFPVSTEEVTTLKNNDHPHQAVARQFGLDCDWGDCWIEGDDYAIFVGKELSRIGAEQEWNQEFSDTELRQTMERTQALLKAAGFTDEPKLRLHFVPDI